MQCKVIGSKILIQLLFHMTFIKYLLRDRPCPEHSASLWGQPRILCVSDNFRKSSHWFVLSSNLRITSTQIKYRLLAIQRVIGMKAPENISSNQCVQRIISHKLLINSIAHNKKEHQLINESPSDRYDYSSALLKQPL